MNQLVIFPHLIRQNGSKQELMHMIGAKKQSCLILVHKAGVISLARSCADTGFVNA
ncbi:hypothetical protein [Malikia sp.]|uniref:hypothetical protein n=1 Tax=Malikia sp. TaxID=2070706 RepID=UPI002619F78E|nr:hypothetical protein [Malikia sp.]MDD2729597.1 hypothetical protein [Malikia sp.]